MPTASTAQILGNNESFEPFTSNLYTRRVLAGEFTLVNKHLVNHLQRRGLWNRELQERLLSAKGSVQSIPEVPEDLRATFKTAWEIPHRVVMDQAIDRAPFICQSQSLNAHIADATLNKLHSMHLYAWRRGLKTGMYYLRTRPKADAVAFTATNPATNPAGNATAAAAAAATARPATSSHQESSEPACESCSA
jgi:ribonucleoside-diphosphate reductase subunit M1